MKAKPPKSKGMPKGMPKMPRQSKVVKMPRKMKGK